MKNHRPAQVPFNELFVDYSSTNQNTLPKAWENSIGKHGVPDTKTNASRSQRRQLGLSWARSCGAVAKHSFDLACVRSHGSRWKSMMLAG